MSLSSQPMSGWTRKLLAVLVCLVPALGGMFRARGAESPARPPNILFILSDEYRQDCVAAYGKRNIQTPNLDRLAREGTRFDWMYAAQPVCSPNRSAIVTGLYPHSSGVTENNIPLPATSKTMAERLAPAGYDCGHFGKWHLGRKPAGFDTWPEYPGDGRGKDHYFGQGASRRYSTDVITDDAIAFIGKERSKSFYAYVSYYPPHTPLSVPQAYIDRYQSISNPTERVYCAMCTKVDEGVGRLMEALKQAGLEKNTLVVFSSDHGDNLVHRWNDHNKRLCYDSSARVPLIARLPGVIPAGRHTPGLISSVDLTPSLLALVGQPVPEGVQGRDLSALFRGTTEKGRDFVFIENLPWVNNRAKGEERCVFDGEWKLILDTTRPTELLNVKADPEEMTNRYHEMKSSPVVANLKDQLAHWAQDTRDDLAPMLIASADEPKSAPPQKGKKSKKSGGKATKAAE